MSAQVRELLATFDLLDPAERQEFAAEILRRSVGTGELSDKALQEAGAAIFRAYDEEESRGDHG